MKLNGLKLLTTLISSYVLMIPLSQAQQSIPTSSRHFDQELAQNQKQNQNQLSTVIDDADLARQDELSQGMPNAHPSTHEGSSSMQDHIDMDDDDNDDDDDDVPDNEDSLGSAPSV